MPGGEKGKDVIVDIDKGSFSKTEMKEILSNIEGHISEAVTTITMHLEKSNKQFKEELMTTFADILIKMPCSKHQKDMKDILVRLDNLEDIVKQKYPAKWWGKKIFKMAGGVLFASTIGFLYIWFLTDIF
jgi:hypothetical protein